MYKNGLLVSPLWHQVTVVVILRSEYVPETTDYWDANSEKL